MPKTTSSGTPKKSELPATLKRSSQKAQRTFAKAYDSAMDEYHDEERAHRVAYDALKHTFEKVGDRWEAKSAPGPSDSQSKGGKNTNRQTAGGVDAECLEGAPLCRGETTRHLWPLDHDQGRTRRGARTRKQPEDEEQVLNSPARKHTAESISARTRRRRS